MPPLLRSFSYLGPHRYSLTYCTHDRRRTFVSERVVALARSQIHRAALETAFAVIAYCFIPDHLHLLIEGTTETADCRKFVTHSKRYAAHCHHQQFGGRLWQRYSYDRVLRSTEATFAVARYILENPIRAGIVTCVEDYPFLGSLVYSLPELIESVRRY